MTWAEFVDAVESHLAVEANRRGMEAFRARYIRNAVLDLQRYIRGYRTANTTIYTEADFATEDQAQLGTLPTGAKPKAFYIYSVDEELDNPLCYRYRLGFYPWLNRQDMICGRLNFSSWWAGVWCSTTGCPPTTLTADQQQAYLTKAYVYTLSPMGRSFLIYPKVTASTRLLLVWDGYKYTFDDDDTVNMPEEAAEAVAAYVQAKIARNVDKNLTLSREFDADYARLRLSLFRDFQETQDAEEKDEEYNANDMPNPNPLQGFGAQNVPFLSTVTAVSGADNTALSFIPTTSITVPYAVEFLNVTTLAVETWVLRAGTDASDGISVQRPNDYDAATNAKVWYKLS